MLDMGHKSEIRDRGATLGKVAPHFASLHAGYSYVQLAKLSPVPVPAGVR